MSDEVLVRMRDLAWEKKQRKAAEARVAELTARVGELEAAINRFTSGLHIYPGNPGALSTATALLRQVAAGSPAPITPKSYGAQPAVGSLPVGSPAPVGEAEDAPTKETVQPPEPLVLASREAWEIKKAERAVVEAAKEYCRVLNTHRNPPGAVAGALVTFRKVVADLAKACETGGE